MKLLSFSSIALLAILGFPNPSARAAAQSPASIQAGHLAARGQGAVRVDAHGVVEFQLFGEGNLVIPDSDDLRVEIHGLGSVRVNDEGTLVAHRFRGTVRVAGHDVRARFGDGRVRIRTFGHGRALLRGMGGFDANGVTGHWSAAGTPVHW